MLTSAQVGAGAGMSTEAGVDYHDKKTFAELHPGMVKRGYTVRTLPSMILRSLSLSSRTNSSDIMIGSLLYNGVICLSTSIACATRFRRPRFDPCTSR